MCGVCVFQKNINKIKQYTLQIFRLTENGTPNFCIKSTHYFYFLFKFSMGAFRIDYK